jgi:hypothetical protein
MQTASKRWRVYVLALLAGLVVAVAGVAAGCGSTKTVTKTVTVTSTSTSQAPTSLNVQLPPATRAGQTTQWGHIKSLRRKDGHFEMRFDPGLMLHGVTAERASLEDRGTSEITNDYYVREEGHRLLTYVVAANAPVGIVTARDFHVRITVSELAQLFSGKNPRHRALMGGGVRGFGFWIRVGDKYPNPVLSLDQQFQP